MVQDLKSKDNKSKVQSLSLNIQGFKSGVVACSLGSWFCFPTVSRFGLLGSRRMVRTCAVWMQKGERGLDIGLRNDVGSAWPRG